MTEDLCARESKNFPMGLAYSSGSNTVAASAVSFDVGGAETTGINVGTNAAAACVTSLGKSTGSTTVTGATVNLGTAATTATVGNASGTTAIQGSVIKVRDVDVGVGGFFTKTANQSVGGADATLVSWTTPPWMSAVTRSPTFDTTSGVVTINATGVYLMSFSVLATGASGYMGCGFSINDAGLDAGNSKQVVQTTTGSSSAIITSTLVVPLAATNTVRLKCRGTTTYTLCSTDPKCQMSIVLLPGFAS